MATKRSTIIPKAPVARLLLNEGAKRVSQEAVDELVKVLETKAAEVAAKAVTNSKHAGRKTVHDSDIALATKQ